MEQRDLYLESRQDIARKALRTVTMARVLKQSAVISASLISSQRFKEALARASIPATVLLPHWSTNHVEQIEGRILSTTSHPLKVVEERAIKENITTLLIKSVENGEWGKDRTKNIQGL
jgi:uncharacterized membrane-anchored protein YjiN (DUF445 family)